MDTLFARLKAIRTKPELDAIRLETVEAMKDAAQSRGPGAAAVVQLAFIKASNRVRRVPVKDRTW